MTDKNYNAYISIIIAIQSQIINMSSEYKQFFREQTVSQAAMSWLLTSLFQRVT